MSRGTASQRSQQASTSHQSQQSNRPLDPSSSEAPDFETYGEFHKAILSVFVAQSIMDGRQVRLMFQHTCAAFDFTFPEDVKDYFNAVACTFGTINARIKKYQLAIKKVCSGTRVESYYCLINKSSNSVHQSQEIFTKKELEYLHELIKSILKSARGHLTDHEAGNVETSSRMTQSNLQEMRKKFTALQFIDQDDNGKLMLGPRALAELEPELRRISDEDDDEAVEKCSFCQGVLVNKQGVECGECSHRCHPVCLIRVLEPKQSAVTGRTRVNCSACMKPFAEDVLEHYRKMGVTKYRVIREEEREEKERLERVAQVSVAVRDIASAKRRHSKLANDRDVAMDND